MQHVIKRFTVIGGTVLLVVLVLGEVSPPAAKKRFIRKWKHLLIEAQSPEELETKLSSEERGLVWVKRFEDGSWVIARGESVPGGDWFDATLLRASSGRVMLTDFRFSGFEGLSEYLSRIPGTTDAEYVNYFAQLYDAVDVLTDESRNMRR